MQGEFEKKVQQKIEELQITPSAPVWEKIEGQIQPEKKRRRGGLWIPFIILFLAGGIEWLFFLQGDKNSKDVPKTNSTNNATLKHTPAIQLKNNTEQNKAEKTDSFYLSSINTKTKNEKQIISISPNNLISKPQGNKLSSIKIENEESKSVSAFNSSFTNNEKDRPEAKQTKPATEVMKAIERKASADSIIDNNATKEETKLLSIQTDSSYKKKKVAGSKKKWNQQLIMQTGWSSYSTNASSVFTPSYYSVPVSTTTSNFTGYGQPQKTSKGLSYSVGFGLSKEMSNRFLLAFGLQYAFYSSHIKLGSFKSNDTTIMFANQTVKANGFYFNTGQNDYTNHFHVIEIPVSIQYQLFKKLPLHLSAGASYGRLLRSNLLTYNNGLDIYYFNKENNQPNYFIVFSSLQYNIINKEKLKIGLGPVIQYQVSKLQKENTNNTPHLFFIGIKTNFGF